MRLIEVLPGSCVGCRLCEMVCSLVHEGECSTTKSRIRIYRDEEFGNNIIAICLQCMNAACVESCAYAALSRNETTGVVRVDDKLCNGCEICIVACPIGALTSDRDRGIVSKCDMCDGDPECVKVCPSEALILKEIDPASESRTCFLAETAELIKQM